MALDPRIALMGRAPEVPDIVERRGMRARNRILEQQAIDLEQEAAAQQAAAQIFAQRGVIDDQAAAALMAAGAFKPGIDAYKAVGGRAVDNSQVGANEALATYRGAQTAGAQQKTTNDAILFPSVRAKAEDDARVSGGLAGRLDPTKKQAADLAHTEALTAKSKQLDEFGRFYQGWLAEKGMPPSIPAEFAAMKDFEAFKNQPRPTSDMLNFRAVREDPAFGAFLTEDANRRRPVTTINNNMNPDKVLSVGDAEALGVPFGTTVGQASAMNINPRDTKPLSAEAAKVFAVASEIPQDLEKLKTAFRQNYVGAQAGILLGTDRTLAPIVANLEDQIGRLRSGGAITDTEEKRFRGLIASVKNMAFGSADQGIAMLDTLSREAQTVANNIRMGKSGLAKQFEDGKAKPKATLRYNMSTGKMEPI